MIPKIIHQMGPKSRNDWHPIWEECHESWKEQFPEPFYQHIFWTDDMLRDLIKNDYPEFLELYDDFPIDGFRIDFSRFCILHKYGGIYADLDIFCYKNFYSDLTDEIYLLESYFVKNEIVQNSLMISCPQNEFWIHAMKFAKNRFINLFDSQKFPRGVEYYKKYMDKHEQESLCNSVKYVTGPFLVSDLSKKYKINMLPYDEYNPLDHGSFFRNGYEESILKFNEIKYKYVIGNKIKCRHFLSGVWGEDTRLLYKELENFGGNEL